MKKFLAIAAISLVATGNAFAASAADQVKMCGDAIAAAASVDSADFSTRMLKMSGASVKTVKVRVETADAAVDGVCKIRRGEVVETTLES